MPSVAEKKLQEADFLVRIDLTKCLMDKNGQRRIPAEFLTVARADIFNAIVAIQHYEALKHERNK